jgi:hypothetical protein
MQKYLVFARTNKIAWILLLLPKGKQKVYFITNGVLAETNENAKMRGPCQN